MNYLAYGSNMYSPRLRLRVPSARALGVGALEGWDLRVHKRGRDGSGKCDVVPSGRAGAVVHGVVFEIDPRERRRLDRAEGLGAGYRRRPVQVAAGAETIPAFTYVAQQVFVDDSLQPFGWYKDLVLAGAREHELPGRYVRSLEAIPAVSDPDPERAAEMRRLLNAGW